MSEQWYWKHGRDLLGPLDTQTLEQLIRQRRVADRDLVRLASDETWLTGADVKALFAGGAPGDTSSEAAARLLSQAARLRELEAEQAGSSGAIAALLLRIKSALQHVSNPFSGLLERLGDAFVWCLRLLLPLLNRYVLLGGLVLVMAGIVVLNIHYGSDARNRRIYAELTASYVRLDALVEQEPSREELQEFAATVMPQLTADLETLIDDGRRSPGRSADAFSWMDSAERGWEVAHTRKALIQAIKAFTTLLDAPPEALSASPSRQIFERNMLVAGDLLEGGLQRYTATPPPRGQPNPGVGDQLSHPLVIGFLIVDAVLIVAGVGYWLLRRR